MKPIVTLRGVSKVFQSGESSLTVLKDIDLDLTPGEIVAISGASGSGKSTLLNLIGGLDRPTSGSIVACDYAVDELGEADLTDYRARSLGFVFQFHYLLKDFTALENVMLPAFMLGVPRVEATERARALLDEVGLSERLDHYPTQLSGGERQRAALARALVNQPPLLLADEPTGNLDATNSARVEEILLALVRARGTTLVIVTHDERLASLGERRLHLSLGELGEP
ncbi:MAG: ABC transporter ATP-binding protein [Spirochaetota bacterium]